jgi:hypothetical protein
LKFRTWTRVLFKIHKFAGAIVQWQNTCLANIHEVLGSIFSTEK